MNTPNYRASLSFGRLSDTNLLVFAETIHTDLYSRPAFASPPVTAADLDASITAFSAAKVAQENGGKLATAEKNARRETLLDELKQLAAYVQMLSARDLPLMLSSGFEAVATNRTREPLPKSAIERIVPGMSGTSLVTTTANRNARGHEVIVAELDENNAPGPFRAPVTSTSSRRIPVANLTPGKLYAFRSRAIGGSTGFSDWSDAVTHRAS